MIEHYRYVARGFDPKKTFLNLNENQIFQNIQEAIELMVNVPEEITGSEAKKPDQATWEKLVACLRKIRKSAEFWNKNNGRQGYLNYVNNYIQ